MDPSQEENYLDANMRQRKLKDQVDHSNAGLYKELERLRSLVDVIEGEKRGGGNRSLAACLPITLDNSVMSTVFGLVFLTVISVSIYAFHNLYKAIYKRFFDVDHEPI